MKDTQALLPDVSISIIPVKDEYLIKKNNSGTNHHPDQKYIDALLTNNTRILEELYARFSEKIKYMILKNNGSESDLADVFQDALLSIYHRAKTKGFTLTCPFDAYFYMVCKNLWLTQLNKRKIQKSKLAELPQQENIDQDSIRLAEECIAQQARTDLLRTKLEGLGKSNKEFLELCWSGLSMEEVARTLKMSYGYARKKKSNCMARLVKQIKNAPCFTAMLQ